MSAWDGWVADVLGGIGAPINAQNASFVNAWHQCEGGTASFNPLNTTQPEAGATNYNSVGVKNYPDQETGLRATVTTLENGPYDGIVRDLRAGSFTAAQIVQRNSSEISTWGTRPSCITSQVGGTVTPPPSGGGGGGGGGGGTTPPAGTHGPTASKSSRGAPHTVSVPSGPSGPTGEPKHLPEAWHKITDALGKTLPTRTKFANDVSRKFKQAVR